MCGAVSYALAGYLRGCGIECETVKYEVHKVEHVCLVLSDGRVLDATADQFKRPDGSDMPDVYIGKRPSWYL
jgi:hypothetical protein